MNRIKEIESNWTEFGKSDPYWSVLTNPKMINNKWDVNKFYSSGRGQLRWLLNEFGEYLNKPFKKTLDFGCGPGRMTFQLVKISKQVIGIDISEPMITLARKSQKFTEKTQFFVNKEPNLNIIKSNSIDLVYSFITLQHNPPNIIYQYLNEFVRISNNKSGQILFNLVSNPPWSYKIAYNVLGQKILNRIRKLKYSKKSAMEMHWINEKEIIKFFNENNFKLLKLTRENSAGKKWDSKFYLFERNIT